MLTADHDAGPGQALNRVHDSELYIRDSPAENRRLGGRMARPIERVRPGRRRESRAAG